MTVINDKLGKLQNKLKTLQRDTGWLLGLNQSFFRNAKGARILVYHGICTGDPFRFNTLFVKLKTFEDQLQLYKEYFNIVSLDDFYNGRYNDERFTICITFDDGFANNYKYVLPLLEKYEVPATFFVTAIRDAGYDILWNDFLAIARESGPAKFDFNHYEFIKGKDGKYYSSSTGIRLIDMLRSTGFELKAELMQALGPFYREAPEEYWLQMTKVEIRKLALSKWVTIGSHGYYHNDLANIPVSSMRQDIAGSKQILEKITGREIKALAFPYGSYTREVIEAAKTAGYTELLTTEILFPEDGNDAALKERLTINPFFSNVNQMHANISGNYK